MGGNSKAVGLRDKPDMLQSPARFPRIIEGPMAFKTHDFKYYRERRISVGNIRAAVFLREEKIPLGFHKTF